MRSMKMSNETEKTVPTKCLLWISFFWAFRWQRKKKLWVQKRLIEQEDSGVKIEEEKRSQKCWQFFRSHEITLKVGAPWQHFWVTASIKPLKALSLHVKYKKKQKHISSTNQTN